MAKEIVKLLSDAFIGTKRLTLTYAESGNSVSKGTLMYLDKVKHLDWAAAA